MIRLNLFGLAVCLTLLLAATNRSQQSQPVRFKATHINGNIYLIRAEGEPLFDNVVASIGDDGLLLIDSAYAETEKALRQALGAVRSAPVRFIINTHYHHAGANAAFAGEATIIAHSNARERMKRETKMYGMMKIGPWPEQALPRLTFSDSLTLHFNGEEIRLLHFPNVHTDGDVIAIFTRSNVVATGDFFVPLLGVCDVANGCDWRRYVAGVQRLLEVIPKDAKIAPGHGPLSSYADLQEFAEMLSEVTDFVQKQIKAGKNPDEIKAQGLPSRWRSWADRGIPADFFLTNVYEGLRASMPQTGK